jgi:hypothetical protein
VTFDLTIEALFGGSFYLIPTLQFSAINCILNLSKT